MAKVESLKHAVQGELSHTGSPQRRQTTSRPIAKDASSIVVAEIDIRTRRGITRLRKQFAAEYKTLAERKEELIASSIGKYVIIQGSVYEVQPSIDAAERRGHDLFPQGHFFLGKIDAQHIEECLRS